jgi:hypothetical protein
MGGHARQVLRGTERLREALRRVAADRLPVAAPAGRGGYIKRVADPEGAEHNDNGQGDWRRSGVHAALGACFEGAPRQYS